MTPAEKLTAAREFLEAVRPHRVAHRPVSVLQREDAELRRMLGWVLDVLEEARPLLGRALADAIAYRAPEGLCADCQGSPADLCDGCAGEMDLAGEYRQLAARLGIGADL